MARACSLSLKMLGIRSDRISAGQPQAFRSLPYPFEKATPGSNLSTLPGSTDAALAVKTERFPPYGLPPITAGR